MKLALDVFMYVRDSSFERLHLRSVHVLVGLANFRVEMFPNGGELGTIHADHAKLVELQTQV